MAMNRPRLAAHLASFGRDPDAPAAQQNAPASNKMRGTGQDMHQRPGTEVDLSQFGLAR